MAEDDPIDLNPPSDRTFLGSKTLGRMLDPGSVDYYRRQDAAERQDQPSDDEDRATSRTSTPTSPATTVIVIRSAPRGAALAGGPDDDSRLLNRDLGDAGDIPRPTDRKPIGARMGRFVGRQVGR